MADSFDYLDILADIQHDWPFMTTDDCVPVKVALQLSDSSSLGRADQYGTFKDQHKQLQKALRSIVNGKDELLYASLLLTSV